MSFLLPKFLGGSDTRLPDAAPASQPPAFNDAALREQAQAARNAVVDRATASRRSTVFAGAQIAAESQASRGLLAQTKRKAAAAEFGIE